MSAKGAVAGLLVSRLLVAQNVKSVVLDIDPEASASRSA